MKRSDKPVASHLHICSRSDGRVKRATMRKADGGRTVKCIQDGIVLGHAAKSRLGLIRSLTASFGKGPLRCFQLDVDGQSEDDVCKRALGRFGDSAEGSRSQTAYLVVPVDPVDKIPWRLPH